VRPFCVEGPGQRTAIGGTLETVQASNPAAASQAAALDGGNQVQVRWSPDAGGYRLSLWLLYIMCVLSVRWVLNVVALPVRLYTVAGEHGRGVPVPDRRLHLVDRHGARQREPAR
jgi:hypothetical protein